MLPPGKAARPQSLKVLETPQVLLLVNGLPDSAEVLS
jgi:hypothetical protein